MENYIEEDLIEIYKEYCKKSEINISNVINQHTKPMYALAHLQDKLREELSKLVEIRIASDSPQMFISLAKIITYENAVNKIKNEY